MRSCAIRWRRASARGSSEAATTATAGRSRALRGARSRQRPRRRREAPALDRGRPPLRPRELDGVSRSGRLPSGGVPRRTRPSGPITCATPSAPPKSRGSRCASGGRRAPTMSSARAGESWSSEPSASCRPAGRRTSRRRAGRRPSHREDAASAGSGWRGALSTAVCAQPVADAAHRLDRSRPNGRSILSRR